MPDIFDEIEIDEAPKRDIFDEVTETPARDIFDEVTEPDSVDPARKPWFNTEQFKQDWGPEGREELKKALFTPINKNIGLAIPTVTATDLSIDPGKLEKVVAGVNRGATGIAEGFMSPVGLATLGVGALPKVVGRGVAALFGAHMARETPEAARQFGQAVGEGDIEKSVETGIGTAANIGFAGLTGVHAGGPMAEKVATRILPESIAEPLTRQRGSAVQKAIEQAKADEAVQDIWNEQRAASPVVEKSAEPGTVLTAEDLAKLPEAAPKDIFDEVAPDALPEPVVTKSEVLEPKIEETPANVETPLVGEPAPELKSMGAALAGEDLGQPGSFVSNMFAAIDAERAAMGKLPLPETKARTWDQDNTTALNKMNQDPSWIPDLIEQVGKTPRPLLSWENAGMVWQRAKWKAEANNALSRIARAFDDGRMDDVAQARLENAFFEDKLNDLDKVVGRNGTGSEAGRSLQAQKMAAGDDFTLVEMRLQKRAANGGKPLSEAQDKEVADLYAKIAEKDALIVRMQEEKAKAPAIAELNRIAREVAAEPKIHPSILSAAEKIVRGFETRADAAKIRLREKLKTTAAGVDPTIVLDVAEIGAGYLARKSLDFAQWSKVMLDEFGESIKPYLEPAFEKAGKLIKDGTENVSAPVRKAFEKIPVADKIKTVKHEIGSTLSSKDKSALNSQVQKYARLLVESGIVDREALITKVHDTLHLFDDTFTRRDAMDAISGYGEFKQLSKDDISVKLRGLKGEMQQIAKLEDMAAGTPPLKSGLERREPTNVERELIQKVNDAKNKFKVPMTDAATQLKSALDTVKTRLSNEIRDLESQIANKKQIVPERSASPSDAASEALKKKRDELKVKYDELFKNPEVAYQKALAQYKKRTTDRIEELNSKILNKDFTTKPRRDLRLDNDAMRLRADRERLVQQWRQGLNLDRHKRRTKWEQTMDSVVKWRRGFILSGPVTLAKLTSAAIARALITPIEEGVGQVLHMALPELSKRAPREGGGFQTKAEVKAITEGLTTGMADAWKTLRTGKSDLDLVFKKGDPGLPQSFIDVFGNIHGAMKAPVKRAEFARSLEKRLNSYAKEGVDVTDEFVQMRAGVEAFEDANRAIFMQKNLLNDMYKGALRRANAPAKVTDRFGKAMPNPEGKPTASGKVATTTLNVLLPIVKVPTNIVGEIMQYAVGSVTGSARLAKVYKAGIENVSPAEADLVMRHLKKGSLGAAAILIGYFNPDLFGGFYIHGQKRDKKDIKPAGVRIGDLDIGSQYNHYPLMEASQLGATIRKVSDSKLRKKDSATQGLSRGAMAGALGLADEIPFIREMTEISKLMDPYSRDQWIGEMAKSMVVPQAFSAVANFLDKDSSGETVRRKSTGVVDAIQSGIPLLREELPKKK